MAIQFRRTATPNHPPPGLMPGQLAIEMASSPPRLWCGVPYEVNPSGRVQIGGGGGGFDTGDAKLTLKTVADPGWIMMDDGFIDNANGAHRELFLFLWDNIPSLPLRHGSVFPYERGDSAEEDWDEGKELMLPRQLGRAIVIAGAGAGLTNRELGTWFGEETHAPIVAEMAQHYHVVVGSHTHGASSDFNGYSVGYHGAPQDPAFFNTYQWGGQNTNAALNGAATGIGIYNNGSSSPFNILQPSTAWNVMMKL